MKRYCFALDLKDDPKLMDAYKKYHENVWPEIEKSIKDSGVTGLEIYLIENRLFLIMDCTDGFSLKEKSRLDKNNPKVQEWENLMWKYQQAIPSAKPGEKWVLMDLIYKL